MASEDFGAYSAATGAPSVFWLLGCTDPGVYETAAQMGRINEDVPTNHSGLFAPILEPTIDVGTQALVAAALDWLASK